MATVDVPNLDLLTFLFEFVEENHKSRLRKLTQRIAYGLRHHYGIGANGPNKDVVTVMTYGQPMVPAVFFGVIAAGGVYSATSPSSTPLELARQIQIGQSRLIICSTEMKKTVHQAANQCGIPLNCVLVLESDPVWSLRSMDGAINVLTAQELSGNRVENVHELKESLIAILWSSGTTGLPKALPGREAAAKEIEKGTFVPLDYRVLAHLPTSHIAGLFGYFIAPFYSGGSVAWMGKYEWTKLLQYVKQYEITTFYTVPSIYLRISKSPDVSDHFSHVVAASTGSAPMDANLQTSANRRLGNGNKTFIGQSGGMSETTGAVTFTPSHQIDLTGSIGPILPGVELRMVDEGYNDIEAGHPGELLVRSPIVTNGYYNDPQATQDDFHDGWFCSGDIAVMADGNLYIVDGKKELSKYRGLQIAPAELENLLFTHPEIQEAAVVGVPSPEDPGTDWPRAYIVADPSKEREDEVKNYVRDRLAPHKQLRGCVVFVKDIPKNAMGKFLRRELRARGEEGSGNASICETVILAVQECLPLGRN